MDKKRKSQDSNENLECKRRRMLQGIENDSRAGTVKKMVLKNFMCHEYLEVSFDNKISFVIGKNGSGKSAILTGLIVGLGAKANITSRGNSLKNFVMNGKPSGSVEIYLNNTGPDAYQENVFGDTICIQRTILAAGGGTYKIKDVKGQVVSTKARDIPKITQSLNIQVDNPICVLTQDTSRNFLMSIDPRKRFNLYMRATGLETLKEEYLESSENYSNMEELLKEKINDLQKMETEKASIKEKYDTLMKRLEMQESIQQMERELLWAHVKESEEKISALQVNLDHAKKKFEEREDFIKNKAARLAEVESKAQSLQNQIKELQAELENQLKPQKECQDKINELNSKLDEKNTEKHILERNIAKLTSQSQELEERIKNFENNLRKMEEEKLKRIEEISNTKQEIDKLNNLIQTLRNEEHQIKNSLQNKHVDEKNLRNELTEIRNSYVHTERQISRLKNETNNSLSAYGREMHAIVNAINEMQNKFRKVPKGPLGSYLKLKDKKWAAAIEGYITPGMLRSFLVDNQQDGELLKKIFKKFCSRTVPRVITARFSNTMYDISSKIVKPFDGCISIYDALVIADPVVANALIDNSRIESILLIPSGEQARRLLAYAETVPRNCRMGIIPRGDKYYPAPNYKCYVSEYENARFLQVSTDDIIRDLTKNLHNLKLKKESIEKQDQTFLQEIRQQNEMAMKVSLRLNKLDSDKKSLQRKLGSMTEVDDSEIGNKDNLETELKELQAQINQRCSVRDIIAENIKNVQTAIKEKETLLNELKKLSGGFMNRIKPLEQKFQDLGKTKHSLTVDENKEKQELKKITETIKKCEDELKESERVLNEKIEKAALVSERTEEIRNVQEVIAEIERVRRTLQRTEALTDSCEALSAKYENLSKRYQDSLSKIKLMKESLKEVVVSLKRLKRTYKCTEEYFKTLIKHSFSSILEFRQFQGNIVINSAEKSLEMIVSPQQGSQGQTSIKNLSGGERSFSTVAFLYALWQCHQFPFYFLDEFDVYMDKINRTKIMEILIHHAKSRKGSQFVFLTPQDISFLQDPSVSIHRLEDPKR